MPGTVLTPSKQSRSDDLDLVGDEFSFLVAFSAKSRVLWSS